MGGVNEGLEKYASLPWRELHWLLRNPFRQQYPEAQAFGSVYTTIGNERFKLLIAIAISWSLRMSKKSSKAETLEQHKKALREKELKKKQKKQGGIPSSYLKNKK